jgi:hypothetical protein
MSKKKSIHPRTSSIYIYITILNYLTYQITTLNFLTLFLLSYRSLFSIFKEIIKIMMSSSFTLLQVFIVVLVMVTLTTTTKAPQSVEQPSQSYNDEVRIIICKISSHSIVNSY